MHQGDAAGQSVADQTMQKRRGRPAPGARNSRSRAPAVAIQRKPIAENLRQIGAPVRLAVDRGEQRRELPNIIGPDSPAQQHRLPILVRLRDGLHGQQVVFAILKQQGRNRSRRRQARQPFQAQRLAINPLGRTEPVHRNAQFGERLLQHPRLARSRARPTPCDSKRRPCNTAMRGCSAAAMRPVRRRYASSAGSVFDVQRVRQRRRSFWFRNPWRRRRSQSPPGTW